MRPLHHEKPRRTEQTLTGRVCAGMQPRETKLYEEAAALWREVCGEPPPNGVSASALLSLAVERARDVGYDRLVSCHLRETAITRPLKDRH